MLVCIKGVGDTVGDVYTVTETSYRSMNEDVWEMLVFKGRIAAFRLRKRTHRVQRTSTNTSTTYIHNMWGSGTGNSTSSIFPSTYFIETVEYFGMLHGNEHKFSSLGEAIDVMCTKHRMMK